MLPMPLPLALTILPPVMLPVDTVKLVPVSVVPLIVPVTDTLLPVITPPTTDAAVTAPVALINPAVSYW